MKSISELLPKVETQKTSKVGGVNSPRAEQVQAICDLMGFPVGTHGLGKEFRMWLGRTKRLKPEAIHYLLEQAKTGKNPQAFFNWLLAKELKIINEKTTSTQNE